MDTAYLEQIDLLQIETIMNENYILDRILEEAGFDDENVNEAAEEVIDIKNIGVAKINKLQKFIIDVIAPDSKKFLEKNKEAALKCNPVGLKLDKFYTYRDIDKALEESLKQLDRHFDKLSKIEMSDKAGLKELEKAYTVTYNKEIMRTMFGKDYGGDHGKLLINYNKVPYSKIEEGYSVTKADIKDAINFLENCEKDYVDMKRYIIAIRSKSEKIMNSLMRTFYFNFGKNRRYKQLKQCLQFNYITLFNMYGIMQTKQFKTKYAQSKKIIAMASNYNPRQIKESNVECALISEAVQFEIDMLLSLD